MIKARPLSSEPIRLTGHRWSFVIALGAWLCWSGALVLLLLGNLHSETDPLAPQRCLYYLLVIAAGLLTFVPVQYALGLPRLALEGVLSTATLCYMLAFVPPPAGWFFSLPDLPVYVLFLGALFWSTAALVLPFVYTAGQHMFQQRARRLDKHRAQRQAYECGFLVACSAMLAALHVLTWVSFLLLVLILLMAEMLCLSRIRVQSR